MGKNGIMGREVKIKKIDTINIGGDWGSKNGQNGITSIVGFLGPLSTWCLH